MAPYDVLHWGSWAEPATHVALGIGFGFMLERAGFGNSKKLTNQFYLNDMSVLKVMFTAIVTAMVLILAATTVGLLDFERLSINATYLGSGILGGFLFGIGFLIGGYCPGTALVAAATLKLDGLLFALGVAAGILLFGYTVPWVEPFWNAAGSYGRLTLFDWLGLSMPATVLALVTMALVFFAAGEWVERWMQRRNTRGAGAPDTATDAKGTAAAPARRRMRPALIAAAALWTAPLLALLVWKPTAPLRTANLGARIEQSIRERRIQIDPAELADLMRDRSLTVRLFDMRDEAAYNRFHLLDAQRLDPARLDPARNSPRDAVKVLIGANESAPTRAFRELVLQGVENTYVLAGGLPAWTQKFGSPAALGPNSLALGDRYPTSRPPAQTDSARTYTPKVKRPGPAKKKGGGGCGG
ncbi:MAG: YeeE/YedE family protein [Polyangiaceae bacterium]|nr:YeeE/YedE family protein [Polyangiaceae bacterium]